MTASGDPVVPADHQGRRRESGGGPLQLPMLGLLPGAQAGEEWRPFPGRPGWFISNHGRVWSECRRRKRLVRLWPNSSLRGPRRAPGSLHLRVRSRRAGFHMLVHRGVMLAFGPPEPPGKPLVLHNDGDPTNNRIDNLRWGSPSDNLRDRYRHARERAGKAVEAVSAPGGYSGSTDP